MTRRGSGRAAEVRSAIPCVAAARPTKAVSNLLARGSRAAAPDPRGARRLAPAERGWAGAERRWGRAGGAGVSVYVGGAVFH